MKFNGNILLYALSFYRLNDKSRNTEHANKKEEEK